jgi:hypothetical protein
MASGFMNTSVLANPSRSQDDATTSQYWLDYEYIFHHLGQSRCSNLAGNGLCKSQESALSILVFDALQHKVS